MQKRVFLIHGWAKTSVADVRPNILFQNVLGKFYINYE